MSRAQSFVNELHSLEWLGILLARIAVGSLFFLSGWGKLFVPEHRKGFLLVIGVVTPLASVMLSCVMIVATATSAIRNIKA